ncbi:MAG: hypothetical protein ILA03_05720 [Bacteroidaceae bacterium]|nr:hypothetical protein [Bacteroidaceae bacterium]MBP3833439.1 hypothetical protein [Bacteroidaceae bacterium]MBQ8485110.1 hypothetical protein [Bacteroidaceae bacterium]MBQ9675587.1 hypothetical protein [Bacteroidaceae bacterium]
MKTVLNIVLAAIAVFLLYICYESVMGPVRFEEEKNIRDKAVQARLLDIRKAQAEYSNTHDRQYTDNFDSLIYFVKNQKLPLVFKKGVLSDAQLENGLTEAKAMAIINKAKKTGKYDEVKKNGLENFSRDTTWVAVIDTIFPKGFNADSLRYVPFGNGAQFQMDTLTQVARSGAPICLLEVKTPYEAYLGDLDKQEIINLKDQQAQLNKYCGLKIGDLETANNNAGNWE